MIQTATIKTMLIATARGDEFAADCLCDIHADGTANIRLFAFSLLNKYKECDTNIYTRTLQELEGEPHYDIQWSPPEERAHERRLNLLVRQAGLLMVKQNRVSRLIARLENTTPTIRSSDPFLDALRKVYGTQYMPRLENIIEL